MACDLAEDHRGREIGDQLGERKGGKKEGKKKNAPEKEEVKGCLED